MISTGHGFAVVRSASGNQFIDNHALPFQVAELTQGGAIYLGGSMETGFSAEIRGNRFEGNTCTDYGGAIHVGIYLGDVTIAENDFVANAAGACAGAIYQFGDAAEIAIEDNLFVRNVSPQGAAIALERIQLGAVRGNTIVGSTGGVALKITVSGNVTVERNVIALNPDGGVMEVGNTGFVSSCNVLFDNVPPPGRTPAGGSGPGDLLVDPQFCDPLADDYSVAASSPCLPGGNDCGQRIGARGQGCEAVALEITSWGAVKGRFVN